MMEDLDKIKEIISKYFEKEKFLPGESTVPLMLPSYGPEEVVQVIDSLLKKQLTLNQKTGNKVKTFEKLWADYIGVKHAVMVNSGSSANLLALNLLMNPTVENHLKRGDEVITPSVTWTTTISPMWTLGLKPVLVDVGDDYLIDIEKVKEALNEKTKAIMPVHLLGGACNMNAINDLANDHNLFVIEDCCEAHGAEFKGKKVGSFGHLSTFSFFFSHHLTTMEGGAVLTNDDSLGDLANIMRSQGISRNLDNEEQLLEKYYSQDEELRKIDKKYLFVNMGFNFRPTELQGGFGIEQFKKFEMFLRVRRDNAEKFYNILEKYAKYLDLPKHSDDVTNAWFAFPIRVKEDAPFKRKDLVDFLESRKIETRPIMSGNIVKQPATKLFETKISGELKNAEKIHETGFFFGNHPGITDAHIDYIAKCFDDFFKNLK